MFHKLATRSTGFATNCVTSPGGTRIRSNAAKAGGELRANAGRWSIALIWLAAMSLLAGLWRWYLDPASVHATPSWLGVLADWTGSVVYANDPALTRRIQMTRLMLVVTGLCLAAAAVLERQKFRQAVSDLLNQERSPLDLAIFRIVVFWQIYNLGYFDYIVRIASLPDGLQYPPQTGFSRTGPLSGLAFWPLHTVAPAFIAACGTAMKLASISGAIGLFSRTSALVTAALFVFAWGRVEWYGKVDHVHHLAWFALLLAVSPSGDTLSVDALIRRFRRLPPAPSAPSRRYGMPLAFAMILIGIIYLFPGLWKLGRSGLDWAFSANPLHTMHREWKLYGNWIPFFRYDQHPFLYQTAAFATVLFEISFLFLLLGAACATWPPYSDSPSTP